MQTKPSLLYGFSWNFCISDFRQTDTSTPTSLRTSLANLCRLRVGKQKNIMP